MPSVVMPTLSSGCSRIPLSIMSAKILKFHIISCMTSHKTVRICAATIIVYCFSSVQFVTERNKGKDIAKNVN
jgi:hypothetical protein